MTCLRTSPSPCRGLTRQERADRAGPSILANFGEKQRAFLDFVLLHYVAEGF